MPNPEEQIFSVYRTGLENLASLTTTMLGAAERLRSRQLEAVRDAVTRHAELCKSITAADSLGDLLAAQARFADHQFGLALGFWSSHLEAANQGQREALQQIAEQTARMSEGMRSILAGVPPGMEPVASTMQSLLQAAWAAFGMGVRAAEQAAELARSPVATGTAGIREAAASPAQKTA